MISPPLFAFFLFSCGSPRAALVVDTPATSCHERFFVITTSEERASGGVPGTFRRKRDLQSFKQDSWAQALHKLLFGAALLDLGTVITERGENKSLKPGVVESRNVSQPQERRLN